MEDGSICSPEPFLCAHRKALGVPSRVRWPIAQNISKLRNSSNELRECKTLPTHQWFASNKAICSRLISETKAAPGFVIIWC